MPRAIRFRVPEGVTSFDDLVHGPIDVRRRATSKISSSSARTAIRPITCRSSSDDVEMAITHVVRGDDHISNTPKQMLLYRALGAAVPQFAHVPLILGPDKKRLSKRHGATSVMEYERQGYLPEAMVNFLALLGLVARRRRSGTVHARRIDSRRSTSTASAAATPCSIPRSWTGSISSTSCGWRPTSWRGGCSRGSKLRVCGTRPTWARSTRGFLRCSSC